MPYGSLIIASLAGPPSPLNPYWPVPANVVMTPSVLTRRTR